MPDPNADASELPPIVQAGHPVLRGAAHAVPERDNPTPAFRRLVDAMVAVMRAAPGVKAWPPRNRGAPQIIVVEDKKELVERIDPAMRAARLREPLPLTVIVNPVLRLVGDAHATFLEGCLSVRGFSALVRRSLEVEVSGDRRRTATTRRLGFGAGGDGPPHFAARGRSRPGHALRRPHVHPLSDGSGGGRTVGGSESPEGIAAELGVDLSRIPTA